MIQAAYKAKDSLYKIYYFLLLIAQKKKQEEGTQLCRPPEADTLRFSAVDGMLKTHRLRRFRQVQRLIPSTAVMLSGTEWVYQINT